MMVNVKMLVQGAVKVVSKKSPVILTCAAVVGVMTCIGMTAKVTPKAVEVKKQATKEKGKPLTKFETVKVIAPVCWPVAVSAVLTSACIIGANTINMKRNAALVAAYTMSEKALSTYQDKIIETVGENKAGEIQKAVAQETIKQNPPKANDIISTGNGNMLCRDYLSGQYFRSSIEAVKAAVNKANAILIQQDTITLNEFYYELGLDDIPLGEDKGWVYEYDGPIEMHYIYCAFTPDGIKESGELLDLVDANEPCLVLDYRAHNLDNRFH
jgi:arginine exporter protein ArgO